MKIRTTLIIFAIALMAILSQNGCKTSAAVASNTLTVTVSEGVTGTPATGSYTYNIGDTVNYSYSIQEGYSDLKVLLDNAEVAASGTITISGNQTLQAYTAGNGKFTLTVTVGTGVTGTPAAGTYSYNEGDVVDYSYSLASGYTGLSVTVDSTAVTSSGTITMSSLHTLDATSSKQYDITGTWTLNETYADGSTFKVGATFVGDLYSGRVTDSDGGSGTYTVTSSTVSFILTYPNVTYTYSGTLSDDSNMSGTSAKANSVSNYTGTWSAIKAPTARVITNQSSVGKGSVRR